jgi:hypothetical protein
MGSWGPNTFGNDTALDWLGHLIESTGDGMVVSALSAVTDAPEGAYLIAPQCERALAAAEVVAAVLDRPCPDLDPNDPRHDPEAVMWLARERSSFGADLDSVSRRAIERVRRRSELQELWDETPKRGAWYTALGDLERRLDAPAGP